MNFVKLVFEEHIFRIGILRGNHYGTDKDVIYGIGAYDDTKCTINGEVSYTIIVSSYSVYNVNDNGLFS